MKWPESLTLIRHAESSYNALKVAKETNPDYQAFLEAHKQDPSSTQTKELAEKATLAISLGVSDYETPLSNEGEEQALTTGRKLKDLIEEPDVIFVSPYLRTRQTLDLISEGWPALKEVKTYEEERIREQEHGLLTVYNDWTLFSVFNPIQERFKKQEGKYNYRFLQGESVPDVRLRLQSWFDTLVREFSDRRVLAITHHLTILSLRAKLERWNSDQFIDQDENNKPDNCSITILKGNPRAGKNGKLELSAYNTTLY